MQLYEVIRWGNDSDDVFSGGPNGPDTCFLVRADTPDAAAQLADTLLAQYPNERVSNWCQVVYGLGSDGGSDGKAKVLRGPYIEHAYNHGWRQWQRETSDGPWTEFVPRPTGRISAAPSAG